MGGACSSRGENETEKREVLGGPKCKWQDIKETGSGVDSAG
jgi:hypothetical protein